MLILQRKAGESVVIGDNITVSVVSVDGVRVRLAISAPEDIPILRKELLTAASTNRESALEQSAEELLDMLGVLEHRQEVSPPCDIKPDGKEGLSE